MYTNTKVRRQECLALAQLINKPPIILNNFNDWVNDLGYQEDKTNMEALATWVSEQKDILIENDRNRLVQLLRSRFKLTIDNLLESYSSIRLKKNLS